jgi:phosphoribosyl 1,2-cyclic phosphate phosphodiesterase
VAGCRVEPLEVFHGNKPTQGYRIDSGGLGLAYIPDCHRMADAVVERCRGVDLMILDGLRHRPHSTHLTVAESVALLERIGAPRSFLTHMCHDLDHAETEAGLPDTIRLAYDGLVVEL